MTDGDLIGYLLDLLDPDDRAAAAAHLDQHPDDAPRLGRLHDCLLPLEADRDHPAPPPGLAARTLARLAAYPVELSPVPAEPAPVPVTHAALRPARRVAPTDGPDARRIGGRFRFEWAVAAGVGFLAIGLVLSGVTRVRQQYAAMACQNNLRELHHGLTGYADTHAGRFPQIGVDFRPPGQSPISVLESAGQISPQVALACPAAPRIDPVPYAYTLGYRTPAGSVIGLRRSDASGDENDLIPIAADCPAAADAPGRGPVSPHVNGQNVLFVGGHVRFATCALVGPNGDDIYRNVFGQVAAGHNRSDVVLGRNGDLP